MRLIDADEMIKRLQEWNTKDAMDKALYNFTMHRILEQPTIQSQRRTGEWISKGYGEYRCSSCRNIIDLDEEVLMNIKSFDYCPYCGSYNKGEQDG